MRCRVACVAIGLPCCVDVSAYDVVICLLYYVVTCQLSHVCWDMMSCFCRVMCHMFTVCLLCYGAMHACVYCHVCCHVCIVCLFCVSKQCMLPRVNCDCNLLCVFFVSMLFVFAAMCYVSLYHAMRLHISMCLPWRITYVIFICLQPL